MTQLNPNITTAGATLAKTYRKTQGGKMAQKTAMEGKRTKDGREPSLNIGRGGSKSRAAADPEEVREDLIDRHARSFMRQVQSRNKAKGSNRRGCID